MLPGKGIQLFSDLKTLGITKGRIPHLYERSVTQRLIDKFCGDERGAISSYDGIIAARAGGNADDVMFAKSSYTTVANVWSSSFRAAGLPAAGTYSNIPGGAAPDNTNVGALSLGFSNPSGGNSKYLLTFGFTSSSALQIVMLGDLLVAAGNISGSLNTSQTISSTALTRYTSGAGVYMTYEVTTALGGTASNLTVTYTNQSGTGSRATAATAMTTSAIAQRLQPAGAGPFMVLQSGDYGVQSVQSLILSASMTAGVFALNLYKPLMWVPGIAANIWTERDSTTQIDGLQQLVTTAGGVLGCLAMYLYTNTTTSGLIVGGMRACAG